MDFMGKWFQMTVFQISVRLHVYNRLGRKLIKPVICMNDHCGGDSSHKWKKIQGNERMFWFLLGALLKADVF